MIAICGASGTIGKLVVDALQSEHANIRALVRRVPEANEGQVEFASADLLKQETIETALTDVTTLFLLSPIGSEQVTMELNVVQAAKAKQVRRIVKLSVMGADAEAPIEFGRIHGRVENAIRASGCEWTFLRPNMFMQNLLWYREALQQGFLPLPLGDAAVSHVDGRDVAAVAARTLLDDRHAGKIYTVTGPQALTGVELASALSPILGRRIEYKPPSNLEFKQYLKSTGEADYVVEAEGGLFDYWSQGHGSQVTNAVEEITTAKADTLEEFGIRERERLLSHA